jgi:hypothetical protein
MSTVNGPLHDPQLPLADSLPWYHYRWPWVLMLVPFAAVLFGIFMFVTALYYPDDVVVDTYYRDGQAINQLRALDEAAHSLGIGATLEISSTPTQLLFSGTEEPELHLFLYHVTDSNADRSFLFLPAEAGTFASVDDSLAPLLAARGVWYLELRGADNDWRLRQRIETPVTTVSF